MGARKKRPAGDAKVAVAYLRVSTDEQHLGPEAQRAAIEAWGEREKVHVVAWHEDKGKSGGSELDDRPGLGASLASIREHNAGVLVVAKRDRLARDVAIAIAIERTVETYGARIVSADGAGNGEGVSDVFMRRVLDASAEHERGLIRMRTKAALAAKSARGEAVGKPPYGYQIGPKGELLPEPREQATLAVVARLWRDDATERDIVGELAVRGLTSRVGKPFGQTQVHRMIERFRRFPKSVPDSPTVEEVKQRALAALGVPEDRWAHVNWAKLGIKKAETLAQRLDVQDRNVLAAFLRTTVPDRFEELAKAMGLGPSEEAR
jgi:DNA invertase Pin-like site-specific DNA recombinase